MTSPLGRMVSMLTNFHTPISRSPVGAGDPVCAMTGMATATRLSTQHARRLFIGNLHAHERASSSVIRVDLIGKALAGVSERGKPLAHAFESAIQFFDRGRVGNADVTGGTEALAGHDGHMGLAQ